jgi:hypothetical protein
MMQAKAIIEEDGEGFELKRTHSVVNKMKNERFSLSAKKSMAQT